MIPEDVVAEIRAKSDIVAIIGQHVQLRKAGRSYKGLCPFHGERSPSFHVTPDKGFFYCFGCHKKGDVFTFVMEFLGKSFGEAAEQLAALVGVSIPAQVQASGAVPKSQRAAMLEINRAAVAIFCEALADPRASAARAYLASRGTTPEIAAKFALGYAPNQWTYLADKLAAQGLDGKLAAELGLTGARERSGGYYDRFRERLMCPVMMPGGDVVGFSGRFIGKPSLETGQAPPAKYINSPESALYKKSRLLFGLAQAREGIAAKKRALLVEGNFDVISLHQAGFAETVAPLGTALTPEQVLALARLTDEIVLCYDGDNAGRKATMAAIAACVEADVPVRVAHMPDGADPDALVKQAGPSAFAEVLDKAQPGVEYFALALWQHHGGSADGNAVAIDQAAGLIARVTNPTKRDLVVGTIATALRVAPGVIERAVGRAGRRPAGGQASPRSDGGNAQGAGGASTVELARAEPPRPPPTSEELELFALMGDHPALVGSLMANEAVSLLTDSRLRDMYSQLQAGLRVEDVAPAVLPSMSVATVLSGKYRQEAAPDQRLSLMARLLRQRYNMTKAAQMQAQLVEAQRLGDQPRVRELAEQIVSLRKQVD